MKVLSRSWILLLFILCCLNSSFAAVITSKATRSCHLTWVKVVISCLFTSNWKQFTSHTCGWARSSIRCRCALSLHRLIKKKKKNSSSRITCLLFNWNFAERWQDCSCIRGWADFFPPLIFSQCKPPCHHHITQNTLTANNSKNPGGPEKKTPPAGLFVIICHLQPSLSCVCKQTRYLPLTETLVTSSAFPEQKLSTIWGWIVSAGGWFPCKC